MQAAYLVIYVICSPIIILGMFDKLPDWAYVH